MNLEYNMDIQSLVPVHVLLGMIFDTDHPLNMKVLEALLTGVFHTVPHPSSTPWGIIQLTFPNNALVGYYYVSNLFQLRTGTK